MEYMVPEKFDEVVRATEALCTENKDPETGNAVHTGIPLGIGQSLRKVCAVLRCIGLRKEFTAEGKQIDLSSWHLRAGLEQHQNL